MIEAVLYKPEGRGFDSLLRHRDFFLFTYNFRPHYDPGIVSVCNKNEYQENCVGGKGGRYVGLTTVPHLCVDRIEIWSSHPPGTLLVCNRSVERLI